MLARINHTFSLLIVLALFNLAANASMGQGVDSAPRVQPSSATITAAASGGAVRFSAPGNITHIRLEVFSAAGEKVFDSGNRDGNIFDWHWRDEKAPAFSANSYLCVVTVQSLSGKTSRKLANLSFADQQATLKPIEVTQLNPAQVQALGWNENDTSLTIIDGDQPIAAAVIAHDGSDGQLTRTRGAFTFRFGDFFSGKDQEQMRLTADGRLGIGTSSPQATLDVAGTVRATKGIVFADGTVQTTGLSGRRDKGGNLVPNVSGTGTQERIAKWTDNAGTLGDSLLGETAGGVELRPAVAGVGINPILTNQGNVAGFAQLRFYPAVGPDTNMSFAVVPRGTGAAGNRAQFSIFNTDVVADATNYEFAAMRARGTDFVLGSGKSGSGQIRPFMLASGYLADNLTNNGQLFLATNGNVGINNLAPTERLHVNGNGILTGNLTVGGTINGTVATANNALNLGGVAANQYVQTTDSRLSDARSPTAGSGNYIQNTNSQQSANFNILGVGAITGSTTGTTFAITGTQPPPAASQFGNPAPIVFAVVGAKGGNATGPTGIGGQGGNVSIQAGNGGDGTVSGGLGGSITLIPGSHGGGAPGGSAGNVLLAPSAGRVGVGTFVPQSKLHVSNLALLADTIGGDVILDRFYDGTNWRGAALFSYFPTAHGHDVLAFGVSENLTAPNTIAAVKMVVSTNGTVGIGTTSPEQTLHVDGMGVLSTGLGAGLKFRDRGSSSPNDDWLWYSTGNVARFRRANDPAPGDLFTISTTGVVQLFGLGTAGGVALCFNPSNQISLCSSSIRYKNNINNFSPGLDLIRRLRPVSFNWKANNQADMGLVAEEVAAVEPLLATHNDKGEIEGVKYDRVGVVLINAVKEQQAQIESQQTLIQSQQKLLETQQRLIAELKKLVCATNPSAEICKVKEQ